MIPSSFHKDKWGCSNELLITDVSSTDLDKTEVGYYIGKTKPLSTTTAEQWRVKHYVLNAQASPLGCSFCGTFVKDWSNPDIFSRVVSEMDLLTD